MGLVFWHFMLTGVGFAVSQRDVVTVLVVLAFSPLGAVVTGVVLCEVSPFIGGWLLTSPLWVVLSKDASLLLFVFIIPVGWICPGTRAGMMMFGGGSPLSAVIVTAAIIS